MVDVVAIYRVDKVFNITLIFMLNSKYKAAIVHLPDLIRS